MKIVLSMASIQNEGKMTIHPLKCYNLAISGHSSDAQSSTKESS